MLKIIAKLAILTLSIIIISCHSFDTKSNIIAKINIIKSQQVILENKNSINGYLAIFYSEIANIMLQENQIKAANILIDKALKLINDSSIKLENPPENPPENPLIYQYKSENNNNINEAIIAQKRMDMALNSVIKTNLPIQSAQMIVNYDCWVVTGLNNNACKARFYHILNEIEQYYLTYKDNINDKIVKSEKSKFAKITVYFAENSSDINNDNRSTLDEVINFIKTSNKFYRIIIIANKPYEASSNYANNKNRDWQDVVRNRIVNVKEYLAKNNIKNSNIIRQIVNYDNAPAVIADSSSKNISKKSKENSLVILVAINDNDFFEKISPIEIEQILYRQENN